MKALARWIVLVLAAVTIVIAVHHIVDLVRSSSRAATISLHAAYSGFALIAAASGLAVAARAWHRREARLLACYLVAAGFALNAFGLHGLLTGEVHGYTRAADVLASIAAAIGLAALVRFATVFPTDLSQPGLPDIVRPGMPGRVLQSIQRTTARPVVIWCAAFLLALLFTTDVIRFSFPAAMVCVVIATALMLTQLHAGYRVADEEARDKIRWLVAAAAAGGAIVAIDAALLIVYVVSGIALPIPAWDAWLLILGCLAGLLLILVAVFYRGALDPNLVIRRSMIVGAAGPLMIFLFAATEELATNFIADLLNIDARMATWVAAGIVAVVIAALRHRFRALIGRFLPRPQQGG